MEKNVKNNKSEGSDETSWGILDIDNLKVFGESSSSSSRRNTTTERLEIERGKAKELLRSSSMFKKPQDVQNNENPQATSRMESTQELNQTEYVPFHRPQPINISDLVTDETINVENSLSSVSKDGQISFEPSEITGRSTFYQSQGSTKNPIDSKIVSARMSVDEILASSFAQKARNLCNTLRDTTINIKTSVDNNTRLSSITSSSFVSYNPSRSLPRTADMSKFSNIADVEIGSEVLTFNKCSGSFSFQPDQQSLHGVTNGSIVLNNSEQFAPGELMQTQLAMDEMDWAQEYATIPTAGLSEKAKSKTTVASSNEFNSSTITNSMLISDPNFSLGRFFNMRSENICNIVDMRSPKKSRSPISLVDEDTDTTIRTSKTALDLVENTPKFDNRTYSKVGEEIMNPGQSGEKHESKDSGNSTEYSYLLTLSAIDKALCNLDIHTDDSESGVVNQLLRKGRKTKSSPKHVASSPMPAEYIPLGPSSSVQQSLVCETNKEIERNQNEVEVEKDFDPISVLISENKENMDPQVMRNAAGTLSDTLSFTDSLLNSSERKQWQRSINPIRRSPLSPLQIPPPEIKITDVGDEADVDEWPSSPIVTSKRRVTRTKSPHDISPRYHEVEDHNVKSPKAKTSAAENISPVSDWPMSPIASSRLCEAHSKMPRDNVKSRDGKTLFSDKMSPVSEWPLSPIPSPIHSSVRSKSPRNTSPRYRETAEPNGKLPEAKSSVDKRAPNHHRSVDVKAKHSLEPLFGPKLCPRTNTNNNRSPRHNASAENKQVKSKVESSPVYRQSSRHHATKDKIQNLNGKPGAARKLSPHHRASSKSPDKEKVAESKTPPARKLSQYDNPNIPETKTTPTTHHSQHANSISSSTAAENLLKSLSSTRLDGQKHAGDHGNSANLTNRNNNALTPTGSNNSSSHNGTCSVSLGTLDFSPLSSPHSCCLSSQATSPTDGGEYYRLANKANNLEHRYLNADGSSSTASGAAIVRKVATSPVVSESGANSKFGVPPMRTASASSLRSGVGRSSSRCSNSSEFSHRDGKTIPLKVTCLEMSWASTKLRTDTRKTMQIKNIADKRLVVRIEIQGPGFQLINSHSGTLALQSQECRTIVVNFCPTVIGVAIGTLCFYAPHGCTNSASCHTPFLTIPLYGYGGHSTITVWDILKGPVGSAFLTMGDASDLVRPLERTFRIYNKGPLLGFAIVSIDSYGLNLPGLNYAFELEPTKLLIPPGDTSLVRIVFRPKRDDIKKIMRKISNVLTLANMRVICGDEANRQRMRRLVKCMAPEDLTKISPSVTIDQLWTKFPGEIEMIDLEALKEKPEATFDYVTHMRVHEVALTLNHFVLDNTLSVSGDTSSLYFPDGDDTVLFRTVCVASSRSPTPTNILEPVQEVLEVSNAITTDADVGQKYSSGVVKSPRERSWSVTPDTILLTPSTHKRKTQRVSFLIRNSFKSRQYFEVVCIPKILLNVTPSQGYVEPDGGQIEIIVHLAETSTDNLRKENIQIMIYMENERIVLPVKVLKDD